MSSLNRLIEMDHEVGKLTSSTKLLKVADYIHPGRNVLKISQDSTISGFGFA